MRFVEAEPLAQFTTFGIGGKAKFFCAVSSPLEALDAIKFAKDKNLRIFVLGGGSNVLISDLGFDGLVIKNEIMGVEISGDKVSAGAGEVWDPVVKQSIGQALQGIECLSGIPGTAGGAVVQNIGAYGQTLSDVVVRVEAIELETLELKVFEKSQCQFDYRTSLFKSNPGRYLVTKLVLGLHKETGPDLKYPSLRKYINRPKATLDEVRQAVIEIRAAKGMVLMPEYQSFKSVGSFFKNPTVSRELFDKISARIDCPDTWYWMDEEGSNVKLSAACIITQAGFAKGQMIGRVQISPKQPLALVNPGSANAQDVKAAAREIKRNILDKFGIELVEEIVYV